MKFKAIVLILAVALSQLTYAHTTELVESVRYAVENPNDPEVPKMMQKLTSEILNKVKKEVNAEAKAKNMQVAQYASTDEAVLITLKKAQKIAATKYDLNSSEDKALATIALIEIGLRLKTHTVSRFPNTNFKLHDQIGETIAPLYHAVLGE